jgi:3-phenylpropionate/trans-cinnamate dioxygenase ferredoxin reductase subunit
MGAGVVILGAGQAGLETAAALRSQGYQEPVTLIGEERHLPYQRPPLSKDYLAGKMAADSLPLRARVYFENHHIDLRLGERAVAIDRKAHQVKLASGVAVPYDKLVLALGARNRPLQIKGAESVLYLRTLDEADRLKERIADAREIAVIGGGFIGLEIAAVARSYGKPVTVIEVRQRLMARAVAAVLSDFFLNLHCGRGTRVLLSTTIAEVQSGSVLLQNGGSHYADLVLAGIGVLPNAELARHAGLAVGNGIVVNEFLRTEDPAIYALGDCADHPNSFAGGRCRLESVQNAVDQAKCVARGIVGNPTPYRDVPWFWTDQYGIRFQMAGISPGHDSFVIRGSIENHKFSAFYFKAGRLLAVDSVNRFGDHVAARKLLTSGTPLTPEQAADESFDLKKLAADQSAG